MKKNSGFTLIELLVVLAIIGVLIAMLIPAIQMVRGNARKVACSNKIKQLAIGCLSYEGANRAFPAADDGRSFLLLILPFIEGKNILESVPYTDESLSKISVGAFLCPSDAENRQTASIETKKPTNYVGNAGTGYQKFGYNGIFSAVGKPVSIRDVVDGTSNTAMISECLVGTDSTDRLRVIFEGPSLGQPEELEEFAETCRSIDQFDVVKLFWARGRHWTNTSDLFTLYNHVNRPGFPNCTNGGVVQKGIYPPSSQHPGGINLSLADGSVVFRRLDIDPSIWTSLGSRSDRRKE